jgi:transcription antitermination factor NusB
VVSVPGALEVPTAIALAVEAGRYPTAPRYDGFVALGTVIRGETYHFEIVADQSAAGIRNLGLNGVVIGNGILTTEDEDQAWARARLSEGDKGGGAARACARPHCLAQAAARRTGRRDRTRQPPVRPRAARRGREVPRRTGPDLRQRRARTVARLAAVQALYQMELGGEGVDTVITEFSNHRFDADIEGEPLAEADEDYFAAIVRGVVGHQRDIDEAVKARLASNWRMERLDSTLRALLRAGAWELRESKDVPQGDRHRRVCRAGQGLLRRRRGQIRQRGAGRRRPGRARLGAAADHMPAIDVAGEFETIRRCSRRWPIRNGGGACATMSPWCRRGPASIWS